MAVRTKKKRCSEQKNVDKGAEFAIFGGERRAAPDFRSGRGV